MPRKQIVTGQHITLAKLYRAKELRHEMTLAERKLWARLRGNRLGGFHFRRQQVIEPYIVDFYCHQAALVIEVDGGVHQKLEDNDRQREQNLGVRGLHVIRFTNREVMQNLDVVLDSILQVCTEQSHKLEQEEIASGYE
jgi:very-short-patch-repair endonuclease